MCLEFAFKRGGIGILKNFMYGSKSVLGYFKKSFTK